ncbi:MAG: hypothetical protein J5985_09885 [Kiritimatiellae bacterium]|nr:hypothetical protein [Kiritimatiellia bacterium]
MPEPLEQPVPQTPADPAGEAREEPVPAGTDVEQTPPVKRRRGHPFREWGGDAAIAFFSLLAIILGALIWFQPPLFRSSSPRVTYSFLGKARQDAILYRPVAMPTRYYIKLPYELQKTYRWFSVDLRREVCAIFPGPSRSFFGLPAIRRSDPLGLDLEFRHLDNSEWRVGFFEDSIVFSNAILSVRLENNAK